MIRAPRISTLFPYTTLFRSADNIIGSGRIVAAVGIGATILGTIVYIDKSQSMISGARDNLLPIVIDNQATSSKAIPAAMLAASGIVLSGIGVSIIAKGVAHKHNLQISAAERGIGLTLNF